MNENELSRLIDFIQGLQQAGLSFTLDCVREAVMVVIPFPDRYVEAEFFADGRVEVQSFGPPSSEVEVTAAEELLDALVESMNSSAGPDPLDAVFGESPGRPG